MAFEQPTPDHFKQATLLTLWTACLATMTSIQPNVLLMIIDSTCQL